MITAVTAFVPISGHPRPADEYRRLGDRLMAMDSKIPLMMAEDELVNCWLHHYLWEYPKAFTHSIADNPAKNSIPYHIVQAQKTAWLLAASQVDPTADVFCWLDYGIFSVPGITEKAIIEFLERAENERLVTIPGCWDKDYVYNDAYPCWRFCGGVMLVPRAYLTSFNNEVQYEYRTWLDKTNNLSWEVNTWARVEKRHPDMIWWYQADHNEQLFTNYKKTEMSLQ